MEKTRNLLEVLEWGSVTDLVRNASVVSRQWANAIESDELWVVLCESFGFETVRPESLTSKAYFKAQLFTQSLYLVRNTELVSYNVRKASWNPTVALSVESQFDELSSLVLVPPTVIATGTIKPPTGQCASIGIVTGKVTKLATMQSPRCRHGSLYYRPYVYVFGGTVGNDNVTNGAEKLNLSTEAGWTALPALPVALSFSTPCRDRTSAYLFGGWGSKACIHLDLKTDQFSLLPFQVQTYGYLSTAVVYDGRLLLFQTGCVMKWSMVQGESPVTEDIPDTINANWY